ncbi:MAG: hypothetical protein L0Y54_13045 [Sporichthyaceae bacterium]|nr:hypothetical protein [Sporichthyaceae bacterium]
MSRRWLAAAPILALAILTAGCGGDGDDTAAGSPTPTASTPATGASTPGTPASTPSTPEPTGGAGGVPDACTLISSAKLSDLLGSDQGTGQQQSLTPQRSVCMYESGTITAVEIAANYEASRDLIANDSSHVMSNVGGVGNEAFFDDVGGVGQLVAKGDRFFVAVTFVYEHRDSSIETAKQIAAAMLAAAEG